MGNLRFSIYIDRSRRGRERGVQFRFSPVSLLAVLKEAKIPASFIRIRVRDQGQNWIQDAFAAVPDIEQQFEALGFAVREYAALTLTHWVEIHRI